MSTTLYEAVIDEVQLHTESVPRATIVQFVRRAAITLCRESRVWKLDGTEELVEGEDDICINEWVNEPGSTERELLLIDELRYEGKPLNRKTSKQILDLSDRYGRICAYYQPNVSTVTLLNTPDDFSDNDSFIDWRVTVIPSPSSSGMDSELFSRYRDGIVYGAVGMLFSMPRKTWSSPDFAAQYISVFGRSVAEAKTDAGQEFSRRVVRVVQYGGI